jgi:hypothetical protein
VAIGPGKEIRATYYETTNTICQAGSCPARAIVAGTKYAAASRHGIPVSGKDIRTAHGKATNCKTIG